MRLVSETGRAFALGSPFFFIRARDEVTRLDSPLFFIRARDEITRLDSPPL